MIAIRIVCLLALACYPQSNSWHGIIPLRFTRADVEKILGPPTPDSKAQYAAEYRTPNERVFVLYSSGQCNVDPSHGWNVPAGTVIYISVEPNTKPKLAELKLDESKYKKRPDPEILDLAYYTDEEEGISIEVNTANGVVTSFNYWPTSSENSLRCSSPAEDLDRSLGNVPHKIDEYSELPWGSERQRLDGFAGQLLHYPTTEGYIIAYAGKHSPAGQAQTLAERAKSYLLSKGQIEVGRIHVIDGGFTKRWTIELYIVPIGVGPPTPRPTRKPS
jgi:hypothetical protein